ncbi:L-threonylcarbamoyladenylate synthase [Paenibacillus alvei]|uniref:L-threonylcarbamoyladenylate synthase n=1 Tax=Paenibacillus alvei TaxID=44250 RepID=UPI0018CFE36D|nr:L-threonylcarbamoyladenylate synthase [Paenibacillus alvei]MCY9579979.1 L-threonylcarbamoyladenylate synthase [Paenibacillus alvei]MCY9584155.1 L-threonylcarbamoyladenylate synthase [Paenibacillus alvei]
MYAMNIRHEREKNRRAASSEKGCAHQLHTKWWMISDDMPLEQQEGIIDGAAILAAGGTVAFPTETVYGLGADARDTKAVECIFTAKGRPSDNPLIVHIADLSQLEELVLPYSDTAARLMDQFWPGPLTIVLPVRPGAVSPRVTAGLDTVGVRMPGHDTALALIRASGCPVAAPSANRSGRPSPTRAEHVHEDLDGRIDAIVDGGATGVGVESTVVELIGSRVHVLRPGGITTAMLQEVASEVTIDPAVDPNGGMIKAKVPQSPASAQADEESRRTSLLNQNTSSAKARADLSHDKTLVSQDTAKHELQVNADQVNAPRSPGMKYTHYAPKGQLQIVQGTSEERVIDCIQRKLDEAKQRGETTGVLAFKEHAAQYRADVVASIGSVHALEEAASLLYDALRHFDEAGATYMLAEACSTEGIGLAVMNRMMKAAGHRVMWCE